MGQVICQIAQAGQFGANCTQASLRQRFVTRFDQVKKTK
jgi:hypothetical protein